ncbi:peptide chain release factor 1 [Kurthia sibirica]|uniref:Peptide chain release factor 1 n=1 Tax=Kurthia sibirica TaxID=202750 RepID=A0A2U3AKV2_9BACL|nr:peptide chain release factor 1 [Kurthia sibirica]PWI25168.1 peptide chain release factor 1 [Kurthia sibirica]GEK33255.1 peptide chain release factor 1 [Kurthia sibirica]
MFDRLQAVEDRYERLNELLSDPDVVSDNKKLAQYSKEQSDISDTVEVYREYKSTKEQIAEAKEMLNEKLDPDMKDMVKEELKELEALIPAFEERLKVLLIPKDPNDSKNVIMEIRGAAGGDEAALFANSLFRMYSKYAETQGWKIEIMNANPTELGGYKEIVFQISGQGAYSRFKYESGAHRVQRVPETESQGRVHTSTSTVVVMPEAEEVELVLADKDIRVDIYHASGAGGQHVNKTASAVRMTHIPTGVVVAMQDERSQLKNRDKAMKVLRTRVFDKLRQEAQSEIDAERKSIIGTGDRSERIRTYNYPQNRVTDHRIGLTIQKLDQIIEGKLDEIINALIMEEQAEKLDQLNEPRM